MFFVPIKLTGLSQVCISCVMLGFLQSLFYLFYRFSSMLPWDFILAHCCWISVQNLSSEIILNKHCTQILEDLITHVTL